MGYLQTFRADHTEFNLTLTQNVKENLVINRNGEIEAHKHYLCLFTGKSSGSLFSLGKWYALIMAPGALFLLFIRLASGKICCFEKDVLI